MEVAEVTQVSCLDFGLLAFSGNLCNFSPEFGINPFTTIETLGKDVRTVVRNTTLTHWSLHLFPEQVELVKLF